MTRIIKIFGAELEANSSKTFEFFPQRKYKKCVGVLITSGVEVSLFFDGGNEMVFQNLPNGTNSTVSPNKRIINQENKLISFVRGKILNKIPTASNVSIYLVIP